jgi:hypothetical protein
MKTRQFKTDLKSIQNRLLPKTMAPCWHDLRNRITSFMARTHRTWGNAVFMILERGMASIEKEERLLVQQLQKETPNILD